MASDRISEQNMANHLIAADIPSPFVFDSKSAEFKSGEFKSGELKLGEPKSAEATALKLKTEADISAESAAKKSAPDSDKASPKQIEVEPIKLSGAAKVAGFFNSSEVGKYKDKDGALTFDDLKEIRKDAERDGRKSDLQIAKYVEENFADFAGLYKDSVFSFKKEISAKDIGYIPNYEEFFETGKFAKHGDPRVSGALQLSGVAIGAVIGGAVQGLSYLTGIGELATIASGTAVAVNGVGMLSGVLTGGFAGSQASKLIDGTGESWVKIPLVIGGSTAGSYLGTTAASFAWGPVLGAGAGFLLTSWQGEKYWNFRHRANYERMFKEIKAF